jgi:hypothetical protein
MRLIWKLVLAACVLFVLAQLVRPVIPTKSATAEVQASPAVKRILEKSCYSCHSDERRLAWFDQIEPGYWLVRHDILTARSILDFSTLGSAPAAVQRAKLFEAVNMIQLGAMPLHQFLALHPDARVTPEQIAELKAYLAPWGTKPNLSSGSAKVAAQLVGPRGMAVTPISLSAVQPERNGLSFEPSFESWRPLSTTDRGDNSTFRFILVNDIAVKAAVRQYLPVARRRKVRKDCVATGTGYRWADPSRQIPASRIDGERRSWLQGYRWMGLGTLARPRSATLR